MLDLTDKQRHILAFVLEHQRYEGCPPTVRETARAFSITSRSAWEHLKALERKGQLRRAPGLRPSRAYRLVGQA